MVLEIEAFVAVVEDPQQVVDLDRGKELSGLLGMRFFPFIKGGIEARGIYLF